MTVPTLARSAEFENDARRRAYHAYVVRGGDQEVWTAELNGRLKSAMRLMLDYEHGQIGQTHNPIALCFLGTS